jgi:hypothetical protein
MIEAGGFPVVAGLAAYGLHVFAQIWDFKCARITADGGR